MNNSPLKIDPIEPVTKWRPGLRRTGLIAKKIGVYPLWLKNGKKVSSTLFQVNRIALIFNKHCFFIFHLYLYNLPYILYIFIQIVDNEVVKYMPPEKFYPVKSSKAPIQIKRRRGCLVVGAENIDPQKVHN